MMKGLICHLSEGLDFPGKTIENLRVFQAGMSHDQIRMLESSL